MPAPADSHIYKRVFLSAETTELIAKALQHYASRLEHDVQAVSDEPVLSSVIDPDAIRTFRIGQELEEVRVLAEWFAEKTKHARLNGDYETQMSHGEVRKLKSVIALYLGELERERNRVASAHAFTLLGLEALDTKLVQWREKLTLPIFRKVEAEPLQVLDVLSSASPTPSAGTSEPSSTSTVHVAASIEIIDEQLRERCLDLVREFIKSQQSHRFDTVVAEATRILENRVRTLTGLGADIGGTELTARAFGAKAPILRLSEQDAEQEAGHLLFRGAFGFIRNPAHHRVVEQLEKERVIQILGFVDYLLHLAANATRT